MFTPVRLFLVVFLIVLSWWNISNTIDIPQWRVLCGLSDWVPIIQVLFLILNYFTSAQFICYWQIEECGMRFKFLGLIQKIKLRIKQKFLKIYNLILYDLQYCLCDPFIFYEWDEESRYFFSYDNYGTFQFPTSNPLLSVAYCTVAIYFSFIFFNYFSNAESASSNYLFYQCSICQVYILFF